jgi:hypothetical protein
MALLASFKPYEGGNDPLWALNELVRVSKHKDLTAVAFSLSAVEVNHIEGIYGFQIPPLFIEANNEFILGFSDPKTTPTYKARLKFEIGFKDVPSVARQPCVAILHRMAGIVDGIVTALEAESRRIGLFS